MPLLIDHQHDLPDRFHHGHLDEPHHLVARPQLHEVGPSGGGAPHRRDRRRCRRPPSPSPVGSAGFGIGGAVRWPSRSHRSSSDSPPPAWVNLLGAFMVPGLTLPIDVLVSTPSGVLGSDCTIGNATGPLVLNLTTGTTDPPGPNAPISGSVGTLTGSGDGGEPSSTPGSRWSTTPSPYRGRRIVGSADWRTPFSMPTKGCRHRPARMRPSSRDRPIRRRPS